ncbi:MAG: bifunctional 2-polyprenyl-6-hydroxyphenol methylase/3-demethylubiquinol 3-O-methyltransferase UbiG [Alphaproteobacteria bacterium]
MLLKDQVDAPAHPDTTVDAREVARFQSLAEEWWKPAGKFGPVHDFNSARFDYIIDRAAGHFRRQPSGGGALAGLDVLDVGCGAGLLCEPLAARGARLVGIDAASRNVGIARAHAARGGLSIEYRHCLASDIVAEDRRFDVVLNTEVIEHVADPAQLMADCAALVKPGGLLVVATLNRTFRSLLLGIVAAEYVLRWLPRGTHDWRRFVTPDEVRGMLENTGLSPIDLRGVTLNPLTRRWRLSGDTSVNYMLQAHRPSGAAPAP